MSYTDTNKDNAFEDRVRKAAAALYRVTDILSDNEPMKWKLRNEAIELVDAVVALGQKEYVFSQNYYYPLLISERLTSKIAIAAAGGYISRINYQVLEQEYASIAEILFENMSDNKGQNILSDISIGHHKRHIKDTNFSRKKVDNDNGMESKKSKNGVHETSSSSERQKHIATVLAGKGWLPVTEVAALCGEESSIKTIQRDLLLLMQNGVIQSKGERRWRTYALTESHK